MRRWVAGVGLLAVITGCSGKLETGYEPRRLGSTTTERRGYYAAPYTPEARAAATAQQDQMRSRRPTPGN